VGTVDFGGGTLTTASFDAFVAKFDSTGTYQWAKQYGDSNGADVSDVAVDTCGNIFVIGSFFGTINFGSGALSATDSTKAYAFLAKIDATGNGAWSEDFIGSNVDALYPGSLAVDGAGGPTFSCGLAGSVDYGGGTLTSESSTAATMSVASFSASGAYRWAYEEESPSTASSGTAVPQGVAASESSMVVLGEFGGSGMTLALPGKTLTAVSGNDTFVASFAP